MQPFKVPATMQPPRFLVNHSANLTFNTNELSTEEKNRVLDYMSQEGWLLFAPNEIQDSEVPAMPAKTEGKSLSQRLHSVMFAYWKQVKKGEGDFDTFYRASMEKLIDNYKNELV
jgi:hypothetical protein